jgi:hypothetical protein
MSFPLFPEHVTARQLDQINSNPDEPDHDYRECQLHGFGGDVEIYRSVLFEQPIEEWHCPGIDGEDAHDVMEEIDNEDPDASRDEAD